MDEPTTITVRTFRMGTDKEAALKPLEEAAEAYASWQNLDALLEYFSVVERETPHMLKYLNADSERYDLADELADTITACCNLAARYGIDLQAALDRVERRNRERGRYA
jgi:NTP pyrophosphatase (non-canonical NTP hydrolase)